MAEITPEIEALAGGVHSGLGTGGMATKIMAARIAAGAGVDMVIANGGTPALLYDIVEGKPVGTRFIAESEPILSGYRRAPRTGPAIFYKEAFAMTTHEILLAAQAARQPLALASTDAKNAALEAMAVALVAAAPEILAANRQDIDAARGKVSDVMLDRLALTNTPPGRHAKGMREVAAPARPGGRSAAQDRAAQRPG